jgi:hypothetical protein
MSKSPGLPDDPPPPAPRKRRGHKPSPRTGQVHAKVLPAIAREISREAVQRGVQQGGLIEEAWGAL